MAVTLTNELEAWRWPIHRQVLRTSRTLLSFDLLPSYCIVFSFPCRLYVPSSDMSSRALRKLQRLREEEGVKGETVESDDSNGETGDTDDSSAAATGRPAFNAFDLLNAGGDDEEEADDEDDDDAPETPEFSNISAVREDPKPLTETSQGSEKTKKKNKQKKKGKKGKGKTKEVIDENVSAPAMQEEVSNAAKNSKKTKGNKKGNVDEIDQALQELSLRASSQKPSRSEAGNDKTDSSDSQTSETLCHLLAVETRNLDTLNEMRKLFGNIVLSERESSAPPPPRVNRRRRGGQIQLDLGSALTGRYSPASRGQELSGIGSRRNVLMPGKDEWPRAPSGGLGMELVEKPGQQQMRGTKVGGVREYKLVHNSAYMDTQRQFEICVESMQPENLIQHLQLNREWLSFVFL